MQQSLIIAETYADIFGYIAFFGALIGWLFQWKKNNDNKKQEIRMLWDSISTIKSAMEEIESAILRNKEVKFPYEIYQTHAQLAVLFRNTLTRAISREGKVTLKTIKKWRKCGKLASDWQQKCAMTILFTEELSNKDLDDLDEKYSSWEGLDNTSALGSGNPSDDPSRKT